MRVVVRWVLVSLVAISVVFAIAFAWLKLGGQLIGDGPQAIGTHGAQIELPDGWEGDEVSDDVVQFLCERRLGRNSKKPYVWIVQELETSVECRADAERILEEMAPEARSGERVRPRAVEYAEEDGVHRAWQEIDTKERSEELTTRFDLLSHHGLTYVFRTWVPKDGREALGEEAASFVDGFEFPGADSKWEERHRPITKRVVWGGYRISFSIRRTAFAPEDSESALASFMSLDDESGVHIAEADVSGSLEQYLDEMTDDLREDWPALETRSREDVKISAIACRRAVMDVEGDAVVLVVAPLRGGNALDIRYISPGASDLPRAERDLFFSTLRIEPIENIGAFPEVDGAAAQPEESPVDEYVERLLAKARLLGDTGLAYVVRASRVGDDLIVAGNNEVRRLPAASTTSESLYRASDWQRSLTFAEGPAGLVIVDDRQEVLRLERGTAEPTGTAANRVVPGGKNGILLLRPGTAPFVPGLGELPWVGPERLIALQEDGTERVVHEFSTRVQDLATNGAGTAVLANTASRVESYPATNHVAIVPFDGGAARQLEGWETVSTLAPAGDGWLLTGRREGEPSGIYRIAADGAAELLIADPDVTGVEQRGDELVLLHRRELGVETKTRAWAVPMESVRAHGRFCMPFTSARLSAIARRVFDGQADGWPFAAADDLRSCARRANEIAVELAGRPLPTTGRDLDRVLGAAAASTMELSGEGEVLLAVLLAAGWLEQGGEWVPGEAATGRFAQRRMQEPPDGLMTVVHSPLEVVASTLYDTEASGVRRHRSSRAHRGGRFSRASIAARSSERWTSAADRTSRSSRGGTPQRSAPRSMRRLPTSTCVSESICNWRAPGSTPCWRRSRASSPRRRRPRRSMRRRRSSRGVRMTCPRSNSSRCRPPFKTRFARSRTTRACTTTSDESGNASRARRRTARRAPRATRRPSSCDLGGRWRRSCTRSWV